MLSVETASGACFISSWSCVARRGAEQIGKPSTRNVSADSAPASGACFIFGRRWGTFATLCPQTSIAVRSTADGAEPALASCFLWAAPKRKCGHLLVKLGLGASEAKPPGRGRGAAAPRLIPPPLWGGGWGWGSLRMPSPREQSARSGSKTSLRAFAQHYTLRKRFTRER